MAKKSSSRRSRGLSGSPSEHVNEATNRLKRLTHSHVSRMTCGELHEAMYDLGVISAEVRNAGPAGRKLFDKVYSRQNSIRSKIERCFPR